jgi:hypothetical protein
MGRAGTQPTALRSIAEELNPDQSEQIEMSARVPFDKNSVPTETKLTPWSRNAAKGPVKRLKTQYDSYGSASRATRIDPKTGPLIADRSPAKDIRYSLGPRYCCEIVTAGESLVVLVSALRPRAHSGSGGHKKAHTVAMLASPFCQVKFVAFPP